MAKPLGAWNADASIFRPIVVAVAPDGREVFRELSRDFTDRTDDEPVIAAIEQLGLPGRPEPQPWAPPGVEPRPSERAVQPRTVIPYFRGVRFNTLALQERMTNDEDRQIVSQENAMAASFLDAFGRWRKEHGQ